MDGWMPCLALICLGFHSFKSENLKRKKQKKNSETNIYILLIIYILFHADKRILFLRSQVTDMICIATMKIKNKIKFVKTSYMLLRISVLLFDSYTHQHTFHFLFYLSQVT